MATRAQKDGQEKARYFVFLVYEESAPDGWWEILRNSHGAFARSPLHQPDEECKKPHWHVIYKHGGPATLKTAKNAIPDEVPANGHIELCLHPRNYQRYLLHLDDPEKQQWTGDLQELIETCNGFPLDLTRDYSKAERAQQRIDVINVIRDNELCEYADLLEGLLDHGMFDLFDYAFNHTIAMQAYLSSRRNRGRSVSAGDEETDEETAG